MDGTMVAVTVIAAVAVVALTIVVMRLRSANAALESSLTAARQRARAVEERFQNVVDADTEAANIRAELAVETASAEQQLDRIRADTEALKTTYANAYQRYMTLDADVRALEQTETVAPSDPNAPPP